MSGVSTLRRSRESSVYLYFTGLPAAFILRRGSLLAQQIPVWEEKHEGRQMPNSGLTQPPEWKPTGDRAANSAVVTFCISHYYTNHTAQSLLLRAQIL